MSLSSDHSPTRALKAPVPLHLPVGAVLCAIAWWTAWAGPRPLSDYTFFPLWFGYILTVDGLSVWRSGSSLLLRDRTRFVLLFAYSLPLWWLFEFANRFLDNWSYQVPHTYHPLAYAALASLAFSTVMPAVFVTAELYRGLFSFHGGRSWIRIAPSQRGLMILAIGGLAMFVASLAFPDVAYPLVWIGLFVMLDAINALTGGRSIAAQIATGRWDNVLVLFAAGLTCGLLWEMWNYWSMPRWVYDVPHVPDVRLFEMPLPGYGGYLPFALEIYAVYSLLENVLFRRRDAWLTFDRPN